MPIYSPPKTYNTGSILSASGDIALSGAGILASTGIGAVPAIAIGAAGAIAKGVGTIMNMSQQTKLNEYNEKYKAIAEGEQNAATSSINNYQAMKANYVTSQVNSSLKAINKMIEPTAFRVPQGGGTGIIDKRLK